MKGILAMDPLIGLLGRRLPNGRELHRGAAGRSDQLAATRPTPGSSSPPTRASDRRRRGCGSSGAAPRRDRAHAALVRTGRPRPGNEAGQVDWLDAWWARLDAWIDEQGQE